MLVETGKVKLAAIMDIKNDESKKLYIDKHDWKDVRYYNHADEMLKNEKLDGVCIGTNCSTHTKYAVLASKYNIPIFLEKPVCTTYEDLEKLKGILNLNDKVVVSFPLRMSRIVTYVKELIDSGKIGSVEHVQAYNNVPYGRGYYHKWYRDESITGGLFLQKATHDLDYINYLLGGLKPVRVCAMKSKQIFKGNKPAGLLCENCSETKTCPESPEYVRKNNDHYIIGKWYRDESITGGLFLQKATHDLDYINYLLGGLKPVRVCAMKSKQIFKGNKPAGLLCENCSETKTCPESPENVRKNNDHYIIGKWCCFAEDTGNEDSGSAIIEYDSGMHVVYSQDFIVRNGAGKRGARLIGYKGTIEFDWFAEKITVYKHLENVTETHRFSNMMEGHFGGDAFLVENFINVMTGEEKSKSTLSEGILSAEMCLAARKSSREHTFVEIKGC